MNGVFSSCIHCKAPGWAPEGLLRLFYNLTYVVEVGRGEKWCISLSFPFPLSRSLFNTVLKLPVLERAGPRELNYLLAVVVAVAVEPSSCFFVSHLYTHAHEFQCDDLARRWCLLLLFESGVGAGNGFRRYLSSSPFATWFRKKRAGR